MRLLPNIDILDLAVAVAGSIGAASSKRDDATHWPPATYVGLAKRLARDI